MIIEDAGYWKKLAKSQADTLNAILWFGLISSVTIFISSFSKDPDTTFLGIKFPIFYAWIPLTLFTFFHILFTLRFIHAVRKFWALSKLEEFVELFKDVTAEGGFFMREMKPRILPLTGGPAIMKNDLTTWLTNITALIFVAALWRTFRIDLSFEGLAHYIVYIVEKLVALILIIANWAVGSWWAIALSELTIPKNESVLLAQRPRKSISKLSEFFRKTI